MHSSARIQSFKQLRAASPQYHEIDAKARRHSAAAPPYWIQIAQKSIKLRLLAMKSILREIFYSQIGEMSNFL
jgi:hypothetical protein